MKKILFFLSIASLIIFASCGSDDGGAIESDLSGSVTFDGQTYSISDGIFKLEVDDGNAVGRFFMSDGELTGTETGATASGATIVISMTAINVDASTLDAGSYITSSNTEDMYAFVSVTIIDGTSQETKESFVDGSVTLSGSGNNYDLTFVSIPFGQGVTLTGSISGTYANN